MKSLERQHPAAETGKEANRAPGMRLAQDDRGSWEKLRQLCGCPWCYCCPPALTHNPGKNPRKVKFKSNFEFRNLGVKKSRAILCLNMIKGEVLYCGHMFIALVRINCFNLLAA